MLKNKIIAAALLLTLCASAQSLVSCTSNGGMGGTPSVSDTEKATEKNDTNVVSDTSITDNTETDSSRMIIIPNGK